MFPRSQILEKTFQKTCSFGLWQIQSPSDKRSDFNRFSKNFFLKIVCFTALIEKKREKKVENKKSTKIDFLLVSRIFDFLVIFPEVFDDKENHLQKVKLFWISLFNVKVLFLYPLKISQNKWFSKGFLKRPMACNG